MFQNLRIYIYFIHNMDSFTIPKIKFKVILIKHLICVTIKMNGGISMWLVFAFGSALLAGLTAILSKVGVKDTDSTVAFFLRKSCH